MLERDHDWDSLTYKEAKAQALYPVMKFFSDGPLSVLSHDVQGVDSDTIIIKTYELSSINKGKDPGTPRKTCKFTVSTTTVDLMGDVMSLDALDSMARQAIGKTYFMNHRYNVPDDVYGKVTKADIVKRKMTDPITQQTGDFYCLDYTIDVATSNPVAMKTVDLIEKDAIKLGASVSILATKCTPLDNGLQRIDDTYYLECSVVGIPANQAAWVDQVEKGFNDFNKAKAKAAPAEEERQLEELKNLIVAQGETIKQLAADVAELKNFQVKAAEIVEGAGTTLNAQELDDLKAKVADLEQEAVTKDAEIEELQSEINNWEAIAKGLKGKLEKVLSEPLRFE